FTPEGAEHAEGIVRRHRMIERFLTDVLGVPWDQVHEEAERLEHAMSPVLEERMHAAIGKAETCPHGHPIVAGARPAGVPRAAAADGPARAPRAGPALRPLGSAEEGCSPATARRYPASDTRRPACVRPLRSAPGSRPRTRAAASPRRRRA